MTVTRHIAVISPACGEWPQRPIMQSTRLWKVAGRNACRVLIGSDWQEFRPLHNQSDLRKLMSASGAR